MFSKTSIITLLVAIAQAEIKILNGERQGMTALADDPETWPHVTGVLTSFAVLEGTGCPAGTFTPQPIEAGKSLRTFVDFEKFAYNSSATSEPPVCTLTVDYEFKLPEGGNAQVQLTTTSSIATEYGPGDEGKTEFDLYHEISMRAGTETLYGPIKYTYIRAGKIDMSAGANLFVSGRAGETLTGSYSTGFKADTSFGKGVFAVEKISIGF